MKEISFEKALEKLEKIVEELEGGELPLDDSLKRYEEGVKLAAMCRKKLDKATSRIELLMKSSDGAFETEAFDKQKE